MASEDTVPLLPCASIDGMVPFCDALRRASEVALSAVEREQRFQTLTSMDDLANAVGTWR